MIVLDTNVFSEPFRARPDANVLRWLEGLADEIAITAISVGEILGGVRALPLGRRRQELMNDVEEMFTNFAQLVLPYDEPSARAFAAMQETRRSAGQPLDVVDGMIAAICRSHGLALATRNGKDFRDLDVELIDPWSPTVG